MKMTPALLLSALSVAMVCGAETGSVFFTLRPCEQSYRILTSGGVEDVAYRAGETVVASNVDTGVSVTLVSAAAASGVLTWTPSSSGNWVLDNSYYGAVDFFAGTAEYGFVGNGTLENPLIVFENDDISGFHAGAAVPDGFVVRVSDRLGISGVNPILGRMFVDLSGGVYRISVSENDAMFCSSSVSFASDTERLGPDRKVPAVNSTIGIAYSGDHWTCDSDAESTLTITSPSGVSQTERLVGTGIYNFLLNEKGLWQVELVSASETLSGILRAGSSGMNIVIR